MLSQFSIILSEIFKLVSEDATAQVRSMALPGLQ